jgi:hypothetical protein
VECGTRFARKIEETSPLKEALQVRDLRVAELRFLPGWVFRDAGVEDALPGGVWRMSKRVRDQISKGDPPAFRRANRRRTRDRRAGD